MTVNSIINSVKESLRRLSLCYYVFMFTGLIETTTNINSFTQNSSGAVIQFKCPFSSEVKLGDSISVNGVCLTVIKIKDELLSFEISKETLSISNIDGFKTGQTVNLERAMQVNSRLDGHIVMGHIDGIAKIRSVKNDGFSYDFEFETTPDISKYIVKKGSITVNGISLTVKDIKENCFNVEVIPHTMNFTNLKTLKSGDIVNIETDILSRYIEKFLILRNDNKGISIEMLRDNGYL